MTFNPAWLRGKTIARIDMRAFSAGRPNPKDMAHDPVITFTDGSYVTFFTQETKGGEYGTGISYHKAKP